MRVGEIETGSVVSPSRHPSDLRARSHAATTSAARMIHKFWMSAGVGAVAGELAESERCRQTISS
jgi:hypothetical protein